MSSLWRNFCAWSNEKIQELEVFAMKVGGWLSRQAQAAETSITDLVSTEPGFEISKRVISSMLQAAITVIALQMAMSGAGIGVVSIIVLVGVFFASAIWATKTSNEAMQLA